MYFNTVISEDNGQQLKGYIARPESGTGPGIVLMHEVYGVTASMQALADKLADKGFVVVCPNMYWRLDENATFKFEPSKEILAGMTQQERDDLQKELDDSRDIARNLMFSYTKFDDEDDLAAKNAVIMDTINRSAAFLRAQPECTGKVAASGFCFGARNTYLSLINGANVDAGAAFYATPELHKVFSETATQGIDKPLMFVVGGEDPYISDDEKHDIIVGSSGTTFTYVAGRKTPIREDNPDGNPNLVALYYANNGHGFNRGKSKYSDPKTSDHAISSATEFLHAALAEKGAFILPPTAKNTTPKSATYHPQHVV